MRGHHGAGTAAILALAACASLAAAGDGGKGDKPKLDLRASPRVAFSPVEVLITAQLKGGADLEDFHCPGLDWDWGDGTHSSYESDCAPLQDGDSIERFFRGRHAYHAPGAYNVRLRLRRGDRTVAAASVAVTVRGGLMASASDF